jgi:MIP family channel proteins
MCRKIWRCAIAEFLGTFSLVLVGCGAIMVAQTTGAFKQGGIAMAFGLVVMVMIAATGHISGTHLNPAVTVAFAITRHFPLRSVPVYVSVQILGGVMGAMVLRAILGEVANLGATVPTGAAWRSLVVETLISAALMFVIMAVATDTRAIGQLAAIMIGATVAVNALWAGPISGASMNPARSFGPALISNSWDAHWIYWVGPILGAMIGALAYQVIREPNALAQEN